MKRYFILIIVLLVASINLNLILKPLELVAGGTQGVAIILNGLFNLSVSLWILVINILTLIISYFILPKRTTIGTVVASLIYPLFVRLTSFLSFNSFISEYELVFVFIAGVTCGITGGYIYKLGFSAGGLNTIDLMISGFLKKKISLINFIMNGIIILIGWLLFGLKKAIYSVLIIVISSIIMNYVLKKEVE